MIIRCMKCKTNKDVKAEIVSIPTSKGIKYQAKGVCPDCGTKLSKFTSSEVAGGKATPQPSPIPKKAEVKAELPKPEVIAEPKAGIVQEATKIEVPGKKIINFDPAKPMVKEADLPKKEKKKLFGIL